MSLGRLLTAGRSLVGGSNSEPHYRMSNPKAMPKFGSAKNPFRSKPQRQAPAVESSAQTLAMASAPAVVAQMPAAPAAAQAAAAAPAAPKRARFQFGWLRERSGKLFAWLSRPRAAAPKAAVPRFDALPIQGELALDRIKVVRNDLSDADLEIVTRAPAAAKKGAASPTVKPQPELVPLTAPAATPAPKAGAARTAWNRAGRLLGAMRT